MTDNFLIQVSEEKPQSGNGLAVREAIEIFIAHRSVLFVEGLSELLSKERDLRIAGTASDRNGVLRSVGRMRNGVVILDADLCDGEPSLVSSIKALTPGTQLVLLVSVPDDQQILQALGLGVKGVILDSMNSRLLIACIRKVHSGEEWIEQSSASRLLHRFALQNAYAADGGVTLSRREVQIVRSIARGLTNREIGKELFINEATVKTHVHNVFRKLNVANRVALNAYARTHGLI